MVERAASTIHPEVTDMVPDHACLRNMPMTGLDMALGCWIRPPAVWLPDESGAAGCFESHDVSDLREALDGASHVPRDMLISKRSIAPVLKSPYCRSTPSWWLPLSWVRTTVAVVNATVMTCLSSCVLATSS
jgi:hypothetical protein